MYDVASRNNVYVRRLLRGVGVAELYQGGCQQCLPALWPPLQVCTTFYSALLAPKWRGQQGTHSIKFLTIKLNQLNLIRQKLFCHVGDEASGLYRK